MTRIRFAAIIAILAIALTAVAASARVAGGMYEGKTEQNSKVFVKVKKGKVVRFSANTRMFCTNGEGFRYRMLYHDNPVKIKKGKFKFEGEGKDGADYEFKGSFDGKKASGKLGFHDSSYNAYEGNITFCNANDVKWSAKRQ